MRAHVIYTKVEIIHNAIFYFAPRFGARISCVTVIYEQINNRQPVASSKLRSVFLRVKTHEVEMSNIGA